MESLLQVVVFCVGLAIANAALTCEHGVMSLGCPRGKVLQIQAAMYGRQSGSHCRNGPIHTTACGKNVAGIVASICNDRTSCQVESSNSLFSDPCEGTFKYLEAAYSCINPRDTAVTACEGGSVTLNCPVGTGITIVQANYGRLGRHTCNRNPIETLNCSATNSNRIMNSRCGGRRTCRVQASNSVFGDPCHGTVKYLETRYRCTPQ